MRALISTLALAAATLALPTAASAAPCDEACLIKLADQTIVALAKQDYRNLPWADPVGYSENGVRLMIGDAIWGSAVKMQGKKAFAIADTKTGNVDAAIGDELGKALVTYVRNNGAVAVMATHSAALASICDRTFVLEDGRVRLATDP